MIRSWSSSNSNDAISRDTSSDIYTVVDTERPSNPLHGRLSVAITTYGGCDPSEREQFEAVDGIRGSIHEPLVRPSFTRSISSENLIRTPRRLRQSGSFNPNDPWSLVHGQRSRSRRRSGEHLRSTELSGNWYSTQNQSTFPVVLDERERENRTSLAQVLVQRELVVANGLGRSRSLHGNLRPCVSAVLEYGPEEITEYGEILEFEEFHSNPKNKPGEGHVRWISVEDATVDDLRKFRQILDLPSLPMDDTLISQSRPKVEVYDCEQILLVCHAPQLQTEDAISATAFSQVAFFVDIKKKLMLTFHERDTIGTSELRKQVLHVVRGNVDDLRKHSVAHLLCVTITLLIDRFYPVLEFEGDILDEVESCLLGDGDLAARKDLVKLIASAKRGMLQLRRRVWPFRKCLTRLSLIHFPSSDSRFYFRDVLDHVIQILDILEIHRDGAHSLLDIYLGAQNNRMQEIMQTLAVITAIFVPLTFLTGVEGMNFDNMPELAGKWSYAGFLCIVVVIVIAQIVMFRRRGWI